MLVLLVVSGCGQEREETVERFRMRDARDLRIDVIDSTGESIGVLQAVQVPEGVLIGGRLSNLPPGEHGMHLHQYAACAPPDFASAGEHYNPTNRQHGIENREGPHAGDLGNLVVGPDGTAFFGEIARGIRLKGRGSSLLASGGASLIIHAMRDDQLTGPAGGSGKRIACGVVAPD